jgi:hypothetical protein
VKDGNAAHITRKPGQVKAFRDTWRDGIHSYLTYLCDRLTVAHDLLTDSGSIFVQIGDENVHRVRIMMDEVFEEDNFIGLITFKKTHYQESDYTANIADYLLLYAKKKSDIKFRKSWKPASLLEVDYSNTQKHGMPLVKLKRSRKNGVLHRTKFLRIGVLLGMTSRLFRIVEVKQRTKHDMYMVQTSFQALADIGARIIQWVFNDCILLAV